MLPTPDGCTPLPGNHTPPVLEYPNPDPGQADVAGGYVIRDGGLPSLLSRYIYTDIDDAFAGELRTAQLFARSTGDTGLGVSATNVVSFGEDACGHIYVASIVGPVYRLDPAGGAPVCSPQPGGHGCSPKPAHCAGTARGDRAAGSGAEKVQEEVPEGQRQAQAVQAQGALTAARRRLVIRRVDAERRKTLEETTRWDPGAVEQPIFERWMEGGWFDPPAEGTRTRTTRSRSHPRTSPAPSTWDMR